MSGRSWVDERFVAFRETGDPQAIADVYDATAVELLRIARRWAPRSGEDLVQATFLQAIERVASFDPERPVLPWLIAILQNQARSLRWQERRVLDGGRVVPPAAGAGPDERAQGAELSAAVTAAIGLLPIAYQPVLRLHLRFGFNTVEIAEALGRPVGTVRTQLVRGRALLRRALPVGFAAVLLVGPAPAGVPLVLRAIRTAVVAHAAVHRPRASVVPWFANGGRLVASGGALVVLALAWTATLGDGARPEPPVAVAVLRSVTSAAREVEVSPPSRAADRVALDDVASRDRVALHYAGDGAAASRVWVRVRPLHRPNPYLHERWLQSDDCGVLPSHSLFDEPVLVDVDRGVRARVVDRTPAKIAIPRGYGVRGQVVDATGRAVAGARVWLSTPDCDTEGHEATRTDRDGRFELRALTGRRFLSADTADFTVQEMVEVSGTPGEARSVTLRLTAECGRVHGTVLGSDGGPIAGAEVVVGEERFTQFGSRWAPRVGRCDAAGAFDLAGIPVGATLLSARAPGVRAAAVSIRVSSAEDREHTLRLYAAAELHGCVRTADGRPIEGAWVGCPRSDDRSATGTHTDARGRYRLSEVARHAEVWVRHPRLGTVRRRFVDLAATVHEWNPVLDRQPVPFSGTLATQRGEPLAGWRLWFVPLQRPTQNPRAWGLVAETATDGGFALPFATATPHAVYATPPHQPFRSRIDVVATPGPALHLRVPPAQMPAASLHGRVVDPLGVPIPGARLLLTQPDSLARLPFEAAADGLFRRDALSPGPYELRVAAPGFAERHFANLELSAADPLDCGSVVLARAAEVTLRFRDREHRPIEGPIAVRVRAEGGTRADVVVRGDRWRAALAPGRYVAEGRVGRARVETRFVVRSTDPATIVLVAKPPE